MANSTQLEIPKPCHEDWDEMTPGAQGRFCGSCQKTVVDFSLMSDQQVLEYFSITHGNICGRFANDQLNRSLEEVKNIKKSKWRFVLNLMMPAFLISGKVYSQGSPRVKVCTQKVDNRNKNFDRPVSEKKEEDLLNFTVVDYLTGDPIPFASIRWVGSSNVISSNEKGEFFMSAARVGENKLEISCIGYETATYPVFNHWTPITYQLKKAYKELEPVSVVGFGATVKGRTVVGSVSKITRCEISQNFLIGKLKDSLQLLNFKKSIRLYPNPIQAGSQFFFKLGCNLQCP